MMRTAKTVTGRARLVFTVLLATVLCLGGVPAPALAEVVDEFVSSGGEGSETGFAEEAPATEGLSDAALEELLSGGEAEGSDDAPFLVEDAAEGAGLALALAGETADAEAEAAEGPGEDPDAATQTLAEAARKAADVLRAEAGDNATPYQLIRAAYLRLALSEVPEAESLAAGVAKEPPARDAEVGTQEGEPDDDEAALAALTGGPSTSAGVTRALALVLSELGLPIVEVKAADAQAREAGLPARTWVMACVDGQWYHVDAACAACTLAAARATDAAAQPSCAWLLLGDDDLRADDEARHPWQLVVRDGDGTQAEAASGSGDEDEAELPLAPETYVFADDAAEDATATESAAAAEPAGPNAEDEPAGPTAEDEPAGPTADNPQDPVAAKPEAEDTALAPQYTYHFTLPLDNAWHNTTLSLGDNPDAWQFTLLEPGTVTLYARANSVDMRFSVHAGDSTSTTQYGDTFSLLAEFNNNVEKTSSLTLQLPKGSYYLIARDWASNSSGTYYVRGSFKPSGGNIASATVAKVGAQPYTGKPIKPRPQVTFAGTRLVLGTDYTLSYKNNRKIGRATIVISGKGTYTGTKTVTFDIKQNIAKLKFSKVKKRVTYTGKPIKPKVSVKKGNTSLKRNKHYTVTYKKNRNAGLASIVIKGKGAYAGSKTISFRIVPRSIAKAAVTGCKKKYTYSGYALKPKPKVKVRIGKRRPTLKAGRDYTVRYKKNIVPGTAKIVIKGKGNYKGTRVYSFKVVRGTPYYRLTRDTWNFYNFSESIPLSFYTRIYGSSKGRLLRSRDDGTGGSCYGFSTTVGAIARYGVPKVTSYDSYTGKAYSIYQVYQYSRSRSMGLTAHEFIQAAQIMQYDVRMQRELNRNDQNVNSLVAAARKSIKGGTPMVISIYWTEYGKRYGHAIVPLRVKSNSSSRAVLTVYDCNTPGTPQTLTLYKRKGRLRSMSYSEHYGSFYGCTWSTPANEARGLMKGRGIYRSGASTGLALVATTSDVSLVSEEGERFELSAQAENDPSRVLHVLRAGGVPEAGELFWVDLDASPLAFTGLAEDATLSVATDQGGVDVAASAGSSVVIDAAGETSTVVVDPGASPAFQMTFAGADGASEMRISGTAEGVVVGRRDGSVVTLSGADSLTVMSADAGEVALDPAAVYQVDLASGGVTTDAASATAHAEAEALLVQMLGGGAEGR